MSTVTTKNEIEPIPNESETNKRDLNDLEKEREDLMKRLDKLAARLNILELCALSRCLEIQGVPEKKKENLVEIVKKIGSVVGFHIEEDNIVNCTREAKQDCTSSYRPRTIILEMRTAKMRDQLFMAVINYNKTNLKNKLSSRHLGLSGNKSLIFVNEVLSATIKELHVATKKRANERGYKYVWLKGGKVFVRKTDGAPRIQINTINSLDQQVI